MNLLVTVTWKEPPLLQVYANQNYNGDAGGVCPPGLVNKESQNQLQTVCNNILIKSFLEISWSLAV